MKDIEIAGVTDTGVSRENNEDAFAVVPEIGLVVLADGMGGHLAGEVASSIAVDAIRRALIDGLAGVSANVCEAKTGISFEAASLEEAISLANTAINDASMRRPECAGMGSTLVAALVHANKIAIAHVGDSRLYRFRAGVLTQMTEDHSMIQELVRRGFISREDARTSASKNVLTRALGVEPHVQIDVAEHATEAGDLYLLCSDGLTDVLSDDEIRGILTQYGDHMHTALDVMIEEANRKGGPDNITAILLRTGELFKRNNANL